MVKIPSFDDLKKAGANLVDSAKKGTLVDTLKSHVETLGASLMQPSESHTEEAARDDSIQMQIKALLASIAEVGQSQPELAAKLKDQLKDLVSVIETATGKKYDVN